MSPGVRRLVRPTTPLAETALLTNTADEPTLAAELRSELATADHVDLLCAFIRWHGVRVLVDELTLLKERGVPFRVITTTYRGATERRAVDELVRRFGADVRICFEDQSTKLHAKAWLFRRDSGFDTGYVGSSNLSKSALVDGLEWNVRISSVATPTLVRKFEATFETYWNSRDFRVYDPERDAATLDAALNAESGSGSPTIMLSGLEVRPRPHQERILEALDSERLVHGRYRNLVVAATGTGKTVVAALDYRRLGGSLLFVAHRREILEQALRTYREVLGDGTFGQLMVGGEVPTDSRHVFASIQSLRGLVDLPAYDVVVIDEFHHAEAASYRTLLARLDARELLGLTATPERADGVDVREEFFDGRTAVELGLVDSLEQDLLCPFHYFGVSDNTDLTELEWSRGAYDASGLSNLYTGNDARTLLVLRALRDRVTDVGRMRALGFCVSVEHAEYMARKFSEANIPARVVTGETRPHERSAAAADLRTGTVKCLFTVDLFNEGVDLPTVDTLLLLRPTQSATIFLQQLGRGLRRAPGKAVLTVLDFIGQHRREYRFDARYRALTGSTRQQLLRDIEQGFPYLPAGSQLVLDRVAREVVLANVRQGLTGRHAALVADVRSHGDLTLRGYLSRSGRELSEVYARAGSSWTRVRREAGFATLPSGPGEDALLKRIRSFSHVDDPARAELYTRLLAADGPDYEELAESDQVFARMLVYNVWSNRVGLSSFQDGLDALRSCPAVGAELAELMAITADRARHVPVPVGVEGVSLLSHASYRREEILTGIGWSTWDRKPHGQAGGVVYSEATNVDALLVTLRKEDRDFAPSTRYRDYPISADLFHWESQNSTTVDSAPGQRYTQGTSRVLLFVRVTREDELGSAPYLCLGEVFHVQHQGERPISITWRLNRPMPQDLLSQGSVEAG
ncbi:superfamily II DNA or RNA helicase [Actinomycetospora succinea]|uniref:Superfamily II DNA or RNA helicase n=1 Tax=Actinomycetospora succinea TaxID=663603 RepID=A0A4R6VIC1_9PSEU|nr:superfamily II DNA or RNA helicase [Actinomycetospora succinea]